MQELLDFFPFNIEPGGPFLDFYLVLAFVVFAGALIVRAIAARVLIDAAPPLAAPRTSPMMTASRRDSFSQIWFARVAGNLNPGSTGPARGSAKR